MRKIRSPLDGFRSPFGRKADGGGDPKHRIWAINVLAVNGGDGYVEIHGIEMYPTPFGANIAPGGSPFSSSHFGGNTADLAFDGDYGTGYISATASMPQLIGVDFGVSNDKPVRAIGIWAPSVGFEGRAPKDFDVIFSDDGGSTYEIAWSERNITGWGASEYRRFIDPAAPPASYVGSPHGAHLIWRLAVPLAESGVPCIGEIELRATPGGPDQATGGTAYASSEFNGSFSADKAFDDDPNTAHSMASGDSNRWIAFAFPGPVSLAQVVLRARTDGSPNTAYQRFAPQYGESLIGPWTTTYQVSGQVGWSLGEQRAFTDPAYI